MRYRYILYHEFAYRIIYQIFSSYKFTTGRGLKTEKIGMTFVVRITTKSLQVTTTGCEANIYTNEENTYFKISMKIAEIDT